MAAQAKSSDGAETETEKTVNVTAYAEHDAFKSERAMADALDETTDYYERHRKKSRTVQLVYDDGDVQREENIFWDEVRDALVESGVAHEHLTLTDETEVSRPYSHSPDGMVTTVRNDIMAGLPDELSGGLSKSSNGRWQDEKWTTKLRLRAGSVDYRRVLLHRSERDGRRKYETENKHLSVDFNVEMGPATESDIEAWSEEVVAPFIKALNGLSWVHKVRVTDCKEKVEREGDCFNAL